MRDAEPKTGEQQARALVFRAREQFVNQRTEAINALRAHLYELGYVAPRGIGHLRRLEEVIEDERSELPPLARDIRRLLVTGAMAVVSWALRRGAPRNPWLARMLARKPPMVVAFALANKMARGIWAMLTRSESYRDPAIASAA